MTEIFEILSAFLWFGKSFADVSDLEYSICHVPKASEFSLLLATIPRTDEPTVIILPKYRPTYRCRLSVYTVW